VEKVLKAFLRTLRIGVRTEAEEDTALYATMIKGRKTKLIGKVEKDSFIKKLSSLKK
jgi:hypothetical protein